MKIRFYSDSDDWTTEGDKINSPENLAAVRAELDQGPIIVERWFLRGSSAPERLIFEDFEPFAAWLSRTFAGDAIYAWSYAKACLADNAVASGKAPDEQGRTPRRGPY